jgi:hypothetical protein
VYVSTVVEGLSLTKILTANLRYSIIWLILVAYIGSNTLHSIIFIYRTTSNLSEPGPSTSTVVTSERVEAETEVVGVEDIIDTPARAISTTP